MEEPTLFDPKLHSHLVPQIVKVHQQCILTPPYTIATFLPPLDTEKMTKWWETKAQDVSQGTCFIVLQMAQNPTSNEEEVAGYVMLEMGFSQTGPFRGEIGKLLVSPEHRGKGVARRVMAKLEEVAKEKGRTMLVLDTITGSPAEKVYPRLGYTWVGVIPDFGISPLDGSLHGATMFYKDLTKSQ